ncbi:hypothetical protein S245_019345, partial [Arachis hypogaea]
TVLTANSEAPTDKVIIAGSVGRHSSQRIGEADLTSSETDADLKHRTRSRNSGWICGLDAYGSDKISSILFRSYIPNTLGGIELN